MTNTKPIMSHTRKMVPKWEKEGKRVAKSSKRAYIVIKKWEQTLTSRYLARDFKAYKTVPKEHKKTDSNKLYIS